MVFNVHPDADSLVAAAKPLIGADLLRMTSIEAFAATVRTTRDAGSTRMATWQYEGGAGAILQRDGVPVMLGDCPGEVAGRAATWLRLATAGDTAPEGMVGSEQACAAFARAWFADRAGSYRVRMTLRNHRLTALRDPLPVPGSARDTEQADERWLLAQQAAFAEEAGLPDSPAALASMIAQRLAGGGLRIWNDRVDVAFIGHVRPGERAARIAPVYTLPSHRRRGYAAALVASVARDCLAEGRTVFLVTDLANPGSNRLYARLGFEPLDTFVVCDLVPDA